MKIKYLKKLEQNIAKISTLSHVSIEEIEKKEEELNIEFPQALKEFFSLGGLDYNLFIRGGGGGRQSILYIEEIIGRSEELLKEYNFKLDNYFPFFDAGDFFLFFYLGEGEDPRVFLFEAELYFCGDDYIPGASKNGYPRGVTLFNHSFSEMMDSMVDEELTGDCI